MSDLIGQIQNLLSGARTLQQGRLSNGGQAGTTVTVRVGQARIKAVCQGSIPPGDCVVALTNTGWVALPVGGTVQTGTRQIQFRQSRLSGGQDFLIILASAGNRAWLLGPAFGAGLELSPAMAGAYAHGAIAGRNTGAWQAIYGDDSGTLQVVCGQNGAQTATGVIEVGKTIESIAMPTYGYLQIRATADGQQYLYHCRINADATVDLLAENNTILAIGPGFYLVSFSYSFTRVSYNPVSDTCTFESLSASVENSEQFLVPPIGDPYLVGSGTPTSPCGLPYRSVRILLPHAGGINALTILINNQGITMDSWAVSSIVFDRPE